MDTLFKLANAGALAGWLALVILPRWRGTQTIAALVAPALLGLAYVFLIATGWGEAPGGGFGSVAEVRALFADDRLLVAGWLHYLAFDLFVGAYEVREAERRGVPHLAIIPSLVLTFLFGPAGFLLFLATVAGLGKASKETLA